MSEAFDRAKERFKDVKRPSVEAFIAFSKNNFVDLGLMFGDGYVLQAVEIAEALLEERDVCSNCGMPYCECDEYDDSAYEDNK